MANEAKLQQEQLADHPADEFAVGLESEERERQSIWDVLLAPTREPICLNKDHPTFGSWRR